MSAFTKRLRSSLVAVAVATMTLIPLASPPVSAACHGAGAQFNSSSGWGFEGSNVSTCDNLGDYNGYFRDTSADGFSVRIATRNINGNSNWSYTGFSTGLNINTYYGYADGDHSTNYKICRSDNLCATQGTNWGF